MLNAGYLSSPREGVENLSPLGVILLQERSNYE